MVLASRPGRIPAGILGAAGTGGIRRGQGTGQGDSSGDRGQGDSSREWTGGGTGEGQGQGEGQGDRGQDAGAHHAGTMDRDRDSGRQGQWQAGRQAGTVAGMQAGRQGIGIECDDCNDLPVTEHIPTSSPRCGVLPCICNAPQARSVTKVLGPISSSWPARLPPHERRPIRYSDRYRALTG